MSHKVIALHHCRGGSSCSQSGNDPNRGVPISLINSQIETLIGVPSTPTTNTPAPTPVPTPSPTIICSSGEKKFKLEITSDQFGSETTWKVVNDCSGETILNNGPYPSGLVTQYTEEYCIPHGQKYTFTIFDSFGGESFYEP